MKSSLKTLLAAAVLGATALPMLSLAEDTKPAPPAEGGPRGPGGPGGGQRGRGMSPEQQLTALETAVGKLTDDQKTKITAVYTKQAEKRREMMSDQSAAPEDRMAKMQEMMKAARAEIRALLTAEQQAKFDEMPQQGFGGRGGPGGPRPGGPKKE